MSRSTADFVDSRRLIPAERTKVVYLGVPLEEFSRPRCDDEVAAARAALGIPPETFADRHRDAADAVEGQPVSRRGAAAVVDRARRPRASTSSGKASCRALEAQARALALGDRLVFAGFRSDVAEALSALDLVVFPSLWEGTPLTVLEALAMGKPIVATDADGLQDVLTEGDDAVMVPRRDAAALARRHRRSGRRRPEARAARG